MVPALVAIPLKETCAYLTQARNLRLRKLAAALVAGVRKVIIVLRTVLIPRMYFQKMVAALLATALKEIIAYKIRNEADNGRPNPPFSLDLYRIPLLTQVCV